MSTSRPAVDWEAVECEYRAGIRSLKDIGSEFGVSDAGIIKRAKRDGWTRDLSAKIKAKAEALVSAREVSNGVRAQTKATEKAIIETNAQVMAEKLLGQRDDVQRLRNTIKNLNEELDALSKDQDSLGERTKIAKMIVEATKILVELERKILRMDEQRPADVNPLSELLRAVSGKALPVVQASIDDGDD